MESNKLCVCLHDMVVGFLLQDRNQKMSFSYQKEAIEAISLSMPLKEKTFDDKNCRKFFRGYLPEDPKRLDAMCQEIGSHQKETFQLLKQYGKECNGAITFCPISEVSEFPENPLIQAHVHNANKDFKLSDSFGLFSGNDLKIPVCIIEDKVATKDPGSPSTHFLKISDKNKITNEYLCLLMAKDLGISSVTAKLYPLKKEFGLLVDRYDRKIIDFHHVQSFHQEDFLQALGYFASYKFEWDKGPSLKECFAILQKTIVPAVARLQMVKRVMFNYLIGNTQAHGKNISLLYLNQSKPILAPLYSVVATLDDSQKMAMKIGEHDVIEEISFNDWQQFCHAVGFSFPIFKQIFIEFCSLMTLHADKQKQEIKTQQGDIKELDKIMSAINKRVDKINRLFCKVDKL
jgi:serine/threonine-protein kinase HipA